MKVKYEASAAAARTAAARELAEKVLDTCAGRSPGDTLTALAIAAASICAVSGRDDASNEDLAKAFAWSLRRALDGMRDEPGAGLQ